MRHIHTARNGRRFPGKGLQWRDDAAHLVGQVTDDAQVLLGSLGLAAPHELDSVGTERAHRSERLIKLMRNAGCQLSEHRQLAGLNQFFLRCTQRLFGTQAFADLGFQRFHRSRQISRAHGHLVFQLTVRCLQQGLRPQARLQDAAALTQVERPKNKRCAHCYSERGIGNGLRTHRPHTRQHQQMPGRAGQVTAHDQKAAASPRQAGRFGGPTSELHHFAGRGLADVDTQRKNAQLAAIELRLDQLCHLLARQRLQRRIAPLRRR